MRRRSLLFLVVAATLSLATVGGVVQAADDTVDLTARLEGAQEVPPADPDGRGKAEMVVDVAAGEVCFDIKLNDVATPNRGHIHKQVAGQNGPIVVTFFELRPGDAAANDPRHEAIERGRIADCATGVDTALLADIVANPDQYYVNVHNSRFPGGALRCQIERK